MVSAKKDLTIIIPTYKSDDYFEVTLNHLAKQTAKNFKVLIIDDNSDDETKKIADSFSDKIDITFEIKKGKKGAAASINYAFSKITTPYWALLDSDAFLKPNWVDTIVNLLEKNSGNDVVGAPILASKKGGLLAYLIGLEIESRYQKLNEGSLRHLSTCNIAGKKKILKYIKLNEDLDYAYDHELSFQLTTNRILFILTKQTSCEHVNKSGFFKYFLQQYKIAKYHSFLSKKMPKQALKGDEISPNYLLLQPFSLILSLIFLFINYKISAIIILIMILLNWKFLHYSSRKNFLFVFPMIILILLKNIAWVCGAFVGTVKRNI